MIQHANEQVKSVEINFNDEIRTQILLLILPESQDGLVMVVSNSCGTETLKFNDAVVILLSEEVRQKSSGSTETSEVPRVLIGEEDW